MNLSDDLDATLQSAVRVQPIRDFGREFCFEPIRTLREACHEAVRRPHRFLRVGRVSGGFIIDNKPVIEKDIDLVKVVNRSAHIENLMNQIISEYCAPRAKASAFMWSVVLDSSVMSLGAKAKVVASVAYLMDVKFDRGPLHRLLAIRNAFAHNATDAYPAIAFGGKNEPGYCYNDLWTLEFSGEIKVANRNDVFTEFNTQFDVVKKSLLTLRDAVKQNLQLPGDESLSAVELPFKTKSAKKPKSRSRKS